MQPQTHVLEWLSEEKTCSGSYSKCNINYFLHFFLDQTLKKITILEILLSLVYQQIFDKKCTQSLSFHAFNNTFCKYKFEFDAFFFDIFKLYLSL